MQQKGRETTVPGIRCEAVAKWLKYMKAWDKDYFKRIPSDLFDDPLKTFETNALGSVNILEALRSLKKPFQIKLTNKRNSYLLLLKRNIL